MYEECAALANELATSEELISGMLPVCAIDALSGIEKIKLDPAAEQKEAELHGYQNMEATYTRLSYETRKPGENPVRVSTLPTNFSGKLEAALRSDLEHERLPTWKDFNRLEEEKGVQQVYELRYAYGAPFTARGGVLDHAEPAKGKDLCSAGKHVGEIERFHVWKCSKEGSLQFSARNPLCCWMPDSRCWMKGRDRGVNDSFAHSPPLSS